MKITFVVKKSKIAGVGLFSEQNIPAGQPLFKIGSYQRTYHADLVGELLNHSKTPNLETFLENGNVYVRSLKKINKGDELTTDYGNSQNNLAKVGIKVDFLEFLKAPDIFNELDRDLKRSEKYLNLHFSTDIP